MYLLIDHADLFIKEWASKSSLRQVTTYNLVTSFVLYGAKKFSSVALGKKKTTHLSISSTLQKIVLVPLSHLNIPCECTEKCLDTHTHTKSINWISTWHGSKCCVSIPLEATKELWACSPWECCFSCAPSVHTCAFLEYNCWNKWLHSLTAVWIVSNTVVCKEVWTVP